MVKAKEIKIFRKKIEKADQYDCSEMSMIGKRTFIEIDYDSNNTNHNNNNIGNDMMMIIPKLRTFIIQHYTSNNISKNILKQCINIFENNMSLLYQQSSWGLNLETKLEELNHKKARFLILQPIHNNINNNSNNDSTEKTTQVSSYSISDDTTTIDDDVIGGFIHYRFCYDDDETPSCVVLYIYEIQIRDVYQKKYGFGKTLMSYIDILCDKLNINKIMLTVFKNNTAAMNFYINTLHFMIDESSPSKHGDCNTDYEILSKTTTR